tara:strand:+ start:201 stop:410 length:210 start_codon:yes stop_codon:yes gene_type:complete
MLVVAVVAVNQALQEPLEELVVVELEVELYQVQVLQELEQMELLILVVVVAVVHVELTLEEMVELELWY